MTLPGINTLTLSNAALMKLVQDKLNADLQANGCTVRVDGIRHNFGSDSIEFTITTDQPTTKENHD